MHRQPMSFGLRLLQLYVLLSTTNGQHTLTRLARIFKTSRQSILRMMEQLALLPGIQLETWKEDRERCYRIRRNNPPLGMVLDPDALRKLTICRDIVAHLLPENIQGDIDKSIDVMAGLIVPAAMGDQYLQFPAEPFWKGKIEYAPFQEIISDLIETIAKRKLCLVEYRARGSEAPREHHICPVKLMAFRETLYVRCFHFSEDGAVLHEHPSTLAIHRIRHLRILKRQVALPEYEEAENYFGFHFNDPFEVLIRFQPEVADFVRERVWSARQECALHADGTLDLRFVSTSRPEVKSWVMSFGPDAEILEPADLRAEVTALFQEAAQKYLAGP